MVTSPSWTSIKEFYKEKFGIESWVVELFANMDILLLCASGASNDSISKFTEIPVEEIEGILLDTFKFKGWERDLSFNPYKIYTNVEYNREEFSTQMRGLVEHQDETLFKLCESMKDIEDKIRDEWI